jgi:hypothetical protein
MHPWRDMRLPDSGACMPSISRCLCAAPGFLGNLGIGTWQLAKWRPGAARVKVRGLGPAHVRAQPAAACLGCPANVRAAGFMVCARRVSGSAGGGARTGPVGDQIIFPGWLRGPAVLRALRVGRWSWPGDSAARVRTGSYTDTHGPDASAEFIRFFGEHPRHPADPNRPGAHQTCGWRLPQKSRLRTTSAGR